MKTNETTQKALARELCINHIHLNAVLRGRVKPSMKLAARIEHATGGKIKAVDLRPDIKDIISPAE